MEPKPRNEETQYSPEEQQAFLDAVSAAVPALHDVQEATVPLGGDTMLRGSAEYVIDFALVQVTETKHTSGRHIVTVFVDPPSTSLLKKISMYSYDVLDQKFRYMEGFPAPTMQRTPHGATDNYRELARNAIENAKPEEEMTRFLPRHFEEVMAILAQCTPENVTTES